MYESKYTFDEDGSPKATCWKRCCCCCCSFFIILLTLILMLVAIVSIKTALYEPYEYVDDKLLASLKDKDFNSTLDHRKLAEVLQKAISFKTISTDEGTYDVNEFEDLYLHLTESFPSIFTSKIVRVVKVKASFMLEVKGSAIDKPGFLLLAHTDVVPVVPSQWSFDPFNATLPQMYYSDSDDVRVRGRGAIDDKLSVVTILGALDDLLSSGWTPAASVYVAVGHDEEIGGANGAGNMSQVLPNWGARNLSFILDEGMVVSQGVVRGVEKPVATIGVCEKGFLTLEVTATGTTGHSSMPSSDQAVHKLATAVHQLVAAPHPPRLYDPPTQDMMQAIAKESPWPTRTALSNLWLFSPLVENMLLSSDSTAALLRTTTAVTTLTAGNKVNVIPGVAKATVNHRVSPGESIDDVIARDREAITVPGVEVSLLRSAPASPLSPYRSSPAFSLLATAVRAQYPEAVIAPSMLTGNTDTRWYLHLSPNVYRFLPILLTDEDISKVHGPDESITVLNVAKAARFYRDVIWRAAQGLP